MQTLRNHLRIIFSQVQPELMLDNMADPKAATLNIDSTNVGSLTYHHFSENLLRNLTYEEVDILYEDMTQKMKSRGESCNGASVFALLPEYTTKVLKINGNEPVCRQDQLLNWRYCYLFLGQDLLTTAHMAYINTCEFKSLKQFTWPSQISTDDRRLCDILKNGLAENHFHLSGSTRIFDLSWICLMNHPARIFSFFKGTNKNNSEKAFNDSFQENLNSGVSLGTNDNRFEWNKRLQIACWLRANLLMWLRFDDEKAVIGEEEKTSTKKLFKFINSSFSVKPLCGTVDAVRFQCGKTKKCLDYAITSDVLSAEESNNCCRSLVGERAFLYKAFHYIYSGAISDMAQMKRFMNLFYLYLLIKTQFRCEMIQVNQRYGFKNFAKYQDRKDLIFEIYPEYEREAKHLSVVESMRNGYIQSLEMRIATKSDTDEQIKKIRDTDREIRELSDQKISSGYKNKEAHNEFSSSNAYFYVLHYPKHPDPLTIKKIEEERWASKPRNYHMRKETEKQTMAIANAFERKPLLCTRIRGFDTCNFEIGCRPEVFATAFRFLRKFSITGHKNTLLGEELQPCLSATYHVGEDFMDLLDGLRAIDEAVIFLELAPGERIGHALALGVSAPEYYKLKRGKIVLRKQDCLDNIIWALHKVKKTGIYIDSILKQQLEDKAQQLIYDIYSNNYSLLDYYNSWQIRGDDPELYRFGRYKKSAYEQANNKLIIGPRHQYNIQRIMHHYSLELDSIRMNENAAELYSRYHFDKNAKEKGKIPDEFRITEPYIDMVTALQEKMMIEISQLKIGIETNPSSNVLIGPFDRYEQHPLFRFYPVAPSSSQPVQFVSVNTDDQGVFDTSLAMEYSLLACAMHSMKDSQHNTLYNDDCIYSYLERLRQDSFSQTFPSIESHAPK